MRTVRDADGGHYLLVKQSGDSSLVRDPETGGEHYVANGEFTIVDDESRLPDQLVDCPANLRLPSFRIDILS